MSDHQRCRSLLEAIQDKYECKEPLHIEIFLPKSAPGKTDSGNLLLPRELTLDKCSISHAGDEDEIQLHADVHALDLTGNSLREWHEVFKILDQFPNITFLNLSCNPLTILDHLPDKCYENMVKLVLNSVHLPWDSVQQVLHVVPNLEELHISLNDLRHIEVTEETPYTALHLLHISTNGLTDWEDIEKLGRFFPNLEQLFMIENPIREISQENLAASFLNLEGINISGTAVASWKELEKFRHFPKLRAIRLKGIPLLEGYDEAERRYLVIGYLPDITLLNGSHVKPSEREDAERAFLRHYVDKEEKPSRYDELTAVYGTPAPLAEVDLSQPESVDVSLRFGEKSVLRNVAVHWTLQELKKQLVDFVGQPAKNFRLFLNDPEAWYGLEEMRLPAKKLFTYGIKEGVEILIELKPSHESGKK